MVGYHTRVIIFIFFGIFWLGLANNSFANGGNTYTYAGANNGNWNVKSNWSGGSDYPGFAVGDIAIISTNVNINFPAAVPNAISTITVTSGFNATITVSSGVTLVVTGAITIGTGTASNLTITGAGSATSKGLTFGSQSAFTIGSSSVTGTNFTLISGSVMSMGQNNNVFTNYGTFTANTSTLTLSGSSGDIINNTGTFTATLCPITLGGGPAHINNTGGTFTATGCTITLAQSSYINNTATCTLNASGATKTTVNFGTSSYISNTGTFYAGTSNSQCILNVTSQSAYITNSGSGAKFYLGSTSIIYPSGVLASVTNTSPAVFTLQSDQFGSAAIGPLYGNTANATQNAVFTGKFNTERYYQGNSTYDNTKHRWVERNYRIISLPVNTGTPVTGTAGNYYIGDLNYIVGATAGLTTSASSTSNAFVTGATGGSTSSGNPSMYLYRENTAPSTSSFAGGNFVGITNIVTPTALGTSYAGAWNIPAGNGIFFFYRGNATNYAGKTVSPYVAPENTTLTASGNINQQAITVYDWFTPNSGNLSYTTTTANTAVRGFNMVGNPYASSIDWNSSFSGTGIVLAHINPTIYVFNTVTNQYDTYITTSASTGTGTGSATNIIASGQGFFVQANAAGASLTFTENAKAPTSQLTGGNLLMGTPVAQSVAQGLRLKLTLDSLNFDDIAIEFNSTASAKFNVAEDAKYIVGLNALVGLSSLAADGVNLAVNTLPLPTLNKQVIKLDVEAAKTGAYTLQRTALNSIPAIYDIWLMDNFKKDSLDIRNNTTYVFDIDKSDTASFGANRFSIVIRENPALGLHLLAFTATKATDGAQIVWKTENEQNYTNFTVERSVDNGLTFDVLGGMLSDALGTYSFLDKNPANGANLYRLKLVDLNGTISYSNIVTLQYSNVSDNIAAASIRVYPNPASNVINLDILQADNFNTNTALNSSVLQTVNFSPVMDLATTGSSPASYNIKIINVIGLVVKTTASSSANWQANVSDLTSGTYIIQVINNADQSVVGKSTFIKL